MLRAAAPRSGELATLGLLESGTRLDDMVERETGVGERETVAMKTTDRPLYHARQRARVVRVSCGRLTEVEGLGEGEATAWTRRDTSGNAFTKRKALGDK